MREGKLGEWDLDRLDRVNVAILRRRLHRAVALLGLWRFMIVAMPTAVVVVAAVLAMRVVV